MEMKLNSKEYYFILPITDKTHYIVFNKITFTKGKIRENTTQIVITANIVEQNRTGGTHTFTSTIFAKPFPYKMDLYAYMENQNYIYKKLNKVYIEIRDKDDDSEIILDVDLLDG